MSTVCTVYTLFSYKVFQLLFNIMQTLKLLGVQVHIESYNFEPSYIYVCNSCTLRAFRKAAVNTPSTQSPLELT